MVSNLAGCDMRCLCTTNSKFSFLKRCKYKICPFCTILARALVYIRIGLAGSMPRFGLDCTHPRSAFQVSGMIAASKCLHIPLTVNPRRLQSPDLPVLPFVQVNVNLCTIAFLNWAQTRSSFSCCPVLNRAVSLYGSRHL